MGFGSKLVFAVSLFGTRLFTSPHYTNYTLEEEKVCSLNYGTKELSLGKDNRSALIVRDSGQYFDDWSGRRKFDCKFMVKPNFEMGVSAVIQRMSLRKDPDGHCIDFIQFRQAQKKNILLKLHGMLKKPYDSWDKTICGEMIPFESPVPDKEDPELALNAFIVPGGEDMEVRIHIADKKLQKDEYLGVEIAFTSFIKCSSPIGAYKSCGGSACIYKEYFSDKIINCPYVTCKDEPECSEAQMGNTVLNETANTHRPILSEVSSTIITRETEFEKGLNTKVYITAVSSIFLSFFLFLGCILLCRYFDLLCWSDPPPVADCATELEQVAPSAPPSDSPDKDLPPAYETLFPSR